jgi:hypothetical protein
MGERGAEKGAQCEETEGNEEHLFAAEKVGYRRDERLEDSACQEV